MIADLFSKDVWQVVLGAILALVTSVVMVFVQRKAHERRMRRSLKVLLRHEIETIDESIAGLLQQANLAGLVISLLRITAIQHIRQGYDRNRDWLMLFQDDVRKDVFDFYTQLHITLTNAQSLETFALDPQASAFPNWPQHLLAERQRLLTSFGDLATRGRALLPRIDNA